MGSRCLGISQQSLPSSTYPCWAGAVIAAVQVVVLRQQVGDVASVSSGHSPRCFCMLAACNMQVMNRNSVSYFCRHAVLGLLLCNVLLLMMMLCSCCVWRAAEAVIAFFD